MQTSQSAFHQLDEEGNYNQPLINLLYFYYFKYG